MQTRVKQVVHFVALFLALFLVLGAAGSPVPVYGDEPFEALDDMGILLQLDSPPARIVSLAPHLTEILFSIGVGDRIVATVRHSDYPPEAAELPVLGDAFSVSVEAVVALAPDLILAWTTGGNQRALKQLRELGYPIFLNEASSLEEIGRTVVRIATLVGKADKGRQLQDSYNSELSSIRQKGQLQVSRRIFFQISDSQLFTVNGEHLIGQAIRLCNGDNIFDETRITVPMVSLENVVARDPALIIVARPYEKFESAWAGEWRRLGWSGRVRYIDASLITRPSLRMLDGIAELCNLLHE